VHHDLFRIWFDASCGTISGLRLGRTAQQAVEWPEINAAWGQAVLLLDTLARVGGWVHYGRQGIYDWAGLRLLAGPDRGWAGRGWAMAHMHLPLSNVPLGLPQPLIPGTT
jgi:hypothetical protein